MNTVVQQEKSIDLLPPAANTSITPTDFLMKAMNSGLDLERLKMFMDLNDRYEKNMAQKAFNAAMAEFKKNAPEITVDKSVGYHNNEGQFVGYTHASLGNICNSIVRHMAMVGISHDWQIDQDQSKGTITVTCILTHIDGFSKSVSIVAPPDNSGKKNLIQQSISTISYLKRQTLTSVCGLAPIDPHDDDDGRQGIDRVETDKDVSPASLDDYIKELRATDTKEAARAYYDNLIRDVISKQPEEKSLRMHSRLKSELLAHAKFLESKKPEAAPVKITVPEHLNEYAVMLAEAATFSVENAQSLFGTYSKDTQSVLKPFFDDLMAKHGVAK